MFQEERTAEQLSACCALRRLLRMDAQCSKKTLRFEKNRKEGTVFRYKRIAEQPGACRALRSVSHAHSNGQTLPPILYYNAVWHHLKNIHA